MDPLVINMVKGTPPVLRVRGELDMASAEQLRGALTDALANDPAVVIDLRDVPFIDLSGVRVILRAAQSRNGDGPLRLVNARRVAWLLELVGLDEAAAALHICDGK
jgi:anti-anti-sigma factor